MQPPGRMGNNARVLNKFFTRNSFKIILVVLFLLPVFSRGAQGPDEQRQ